MSAALLRQAQTDASTLATSSQASVNFATQIASLKEEYATTLDKVVANYSKYKMGDNSTSYNDDTAQLAGIENDLVALIQTINKSNATVRKIADHTAESMENVESSQSALNVDDPALMDSTSRRTMLDFADLYKLNYYVVWMKVILIVALLYFLFSLKNVLLSVGIGLGIAILWYVYTLLMSLFTGRNPRGGDTDKIKMCADGVTESDATGSNCPAVCNADTYVACNKGASQKCCWDGYADNGSCNPLPVASSCFNSTYGCCPDGTTSRTATGGCETEVLCASSEFGCCPNGQSRTKDGVCSFQSPCAFSAFGCCADGKNKVDALGSNCSTTALTTSDLRSEMNRVQQQIKDQVARIGNPVVSYPVVSCNLGV